MPLVKTRIKAPKNNNRFRVTFKFPEREENKYHTHVWEGIDDQGMLDKLAEFLSTMKECKVTTEVDKIEWVDDEGIVYAVTGYEEHIV